MRLLSIVVVGCLAVTVGFSRVGAQEAVSETPRAASEPKTTEVIEDLRILSILNVLRPTREQSTQLAAVATTGKEGLAAIEAEIKTTLDQQRPRLLAAREKVLRGGIATQTTDAQLTNAARAVEATRAQKLEALIVSMAGRVRRILSPEQAQTIEVELAPTLDQPWRKYTRALTGPQAAARAPRGLPSDPGKWLRELRDLRIDSAEGDPAYEVTDFARKLTRGLPAGTPLFEQTFNQAKTFATQVLAMPPAVFGQREVELARMMARQELDARNQQRVQEGKPAEVFDAYRWLVEEVLLSPRAAADLRERAAVQ